MIVAVLIPSYGRPAQLAERVGALLDQPEPPGVTLAVVVSVQEGDEPSRAAMRPLMARNSHLLMGWRPDGTTAVDGWLHAYELARPLLPTWWVLGADDIVWRPGWLEEALRVAEATRAQVVGLNDLHTDLNHYAPHYMMHHAYAIAHGFIPPGYQSWWFDRHVCEMAAALGLYAPAWKAIAEHMHPDWHTAPNDATYDAGRVYRDADKQIYLQAKANGFGVQRLVTA